MMNTFSVFSTQLPIGPRWIVVVVPNARRVVLSGYPHS